MPIWDRKNEMLESSEMRQLQLERLQTTVNRAYRSVPFYHHKFEQLKLEPEEIQSLKDVSKLPFTTKQVLQDGYPYEMFAVPLREIVRIDSYSPAHGRPLVIGYTENDIKHWTQLAARIMSAAGVGKDDVVQVAAEYEVFASGFGTHYGVEKLGASLIPAAPSSAERQIRIMRDFRTTALISAPSYMLYIIEQMRRADVTKNDLSLRVGLYGVEPMSEKARKEIESYLGITAAANYGISGVTGPGIAGECECKDGMHIQEDHFLIEIIDPVTLDPLPAGQTGEVVVTTLTQEGLPIIRYRTRDISKITYEPCNCGRTTARMATISGRTDSAICIRGIHVYPADIEALLYDIEHVVPHYQIVVDTQDGLDTLTVNVELSAALISDQMNKIMGLEDTIRQRVHTAVGLIPDVRLVEPKTLRSAPTGIRVIDNRFR